MKHTRTFVYFSFFPYPSSALSCTADSTPYYRLSAIINFFVESVSGGDYRWIPINHIFVPFTYIEARV